MKLNSILVPVVAAIVLNGCQVSYSGGWSAEGSLGATCTCDNDCQSGLSCSDGKVCIVDVCTGGCGIGGSGSGGNGSGANGSGANGNGGCQANSDCPKGSFCELDSAICVYTGVCQSDPDCGDGLTCDEPSNTCVPGEDPPPPPPACSDITAEADCLARVDCVPVYTGVNCSCGPDCVCHGVEPNCVCERFDYFACALAAQQ